jgi:hypothetical protein
LVAGLFGLDVSGFGFASDGGGVVSLGLVFGFVLGFVVLGFEPF